MKLFSVEQIRNWDHYTIKNVRRKNGSYDCWDSSTFMRVPCPGETGPNKSTQTYYATTVKNRNLKHCVPSK